MASYQSSALRSAPGYAPRVVTPQAPYKLPQFALPTDGVNADVAGNANTPGYVQRQLFANQISQLGNQQNAAFTGIQVGAQKALAGYGGYVFQKDDPNTPENESLLFDDSQKGKLGEREKAAYRQQRDQANAAGMLESSFANQNIASAIGRVSLEAQQIANQYANAINQTAEQFANRAADITSQWAGLYGSDSAWLVQNPPPAPVVPEPGPTPWPGTAAAQPEGGYRILRMSGPDYNIPANRRRWLAHNPGYVIKKTGPGNGSQWIGVKV